MKKKLLLIFLASLLLINIIFPVAFSQSNGETILLDQDITAFEADCPEATYKGKFIRIEDETATEGFCIRIDPTAEPQATTPDPSEPGDLIYPLTVPEAGVYTIWVRGIFADTSSDSIYYRIDENTVWSTKAPSYKEEWQWVNVAMKYIDKGTHTLEFRARENYNIRIDKILISKKVAFIPNGINGTEEVEPFTAGEYYNAPPVIPPAEHPRLLARKSDIPQIRAQLESKENIEMWERVQQNADTDTNCHLDLDPSKPSNHSHNYIGVIESSAFLYLIDNEGNRKYGEKAIECYKNYVDSLVCTAQYTYQTRELGYTMFIGSMVYDWCYNLLSEEDKQSFINTMLSYAMQMEVGWPPVGQGNFTGHAVEDQYMTDLISMAIALYDERPDLYQLIGGRLFDEIIPAQNFLYAGGSLTEGPLYGTLRFGLCVMNQWIFRRMGYDNLYSRENENALYAYIMSLKPSGESIVYGDEYGRNTRGVYSSAAYSFFVGYTYYKNPYFKYMFYKLNPTGANLGQGNGAISPVLHLLLNVEEVEQKNVSDLPKALYSGGSSASILAKTTWDDNSSDDGINVRMNFNQYFTGSHEHADSGAFSIDYKGALAMDSGIYESAPWLDENGKNVTNLAYGSDHDVNYHKQTIAHNAMLVRGDGQTYTYGYQYSKVDSGGQLGNKVRKSPGGGNANLLHMEDLEKEGAKQGKILSYDIGPTVSEPDYSYVKADITDAYPEQRVEKYIRQMMFLDFKDEDYKGALIVFDDMTSANKDLEKVWLLHTQEEPEIEGNTVNVSRATNKRSGRLLNETLLPAQEDAVLTKIGGVGHEFEVEGKNYPAYAHYPYVEIGNWRVELTPKIKKKQDYFLNVMQISDNNDEIVPLQSTLVHNDNDYAGAQIKDWVCFFSKSARKYKKNIEFSVPADSGSLHYLVTGLEEGEWSVSRNGETVTSVLVDSEHDTLQFTGEGGNYVLKRQYKAGIPVKNLKFVSNITEKNESVIDIKIDNYYQTFRGELIAKNDTLYVPMNEFLDKIGYEYTVDEDQSVRIQVAKSTAVLKPGQNSIDVNGKVNEFAHAPEIINGMLYAPIEEFASRINLTAKWYDVSQKLLVTIVGKKDEDSVSRIVNSDDPARRKVVDGNMSGTNATVTPYDALDNNLATYWAEEGKGVWIEAELDKTDTLSKVGIYWHQGHLRKAAFEIHVSDDGETYRKVYEGESDGKTEGFEYVTLPEGTTAKYVKIVGYENSSGSWNSIKELQFYY